MKIRLNPRLTSLVFFWTENYYVPQQNYCGTCSARWTVIRKTVAENFSLFREHELANSGQQVKAKEKE